MGAQLTHKLETLAQPKPRNTRPTSLTHTFILIISSPLTLAKMRSAIFLSLRSGLACNRSSRPLSLTFIVGFANKQ
jgi:hypothetical protein